MKLFLLLVIVLSVVFVSSDSAYAKHTVLTDRDCSVNVSQIPIPFQVTWNDNPRSNPDGSLYPGDAFHFLYKYSYSDTCTSFAVQPLVGSANLELKSALLFSDGNTKPQSIILYHWVPKNIQISNFYKILSVHQDCIGLKGGGSACSEVQYTLSENPVLSVRQDQMNIPSILDPVSVDVDKYGSKRLADNIKILYTYQWHLLQVKESYSIGVDKHTTEDTSSVDSFVNFVKQVCSDGTKYAGCVFGHAEVKPEVAEKKICLFDELDKMKINYDGIKEKDECVSDDSKDNIIQSVRGTGTHCSDKRCKSFTVTSDSMMGFFILPSFGGVSFLYPAIPDLDNFDSKNNDGTYYLDDAIGIHSMPDVKWKNKRTGTISFESKIVSSDLQQIDFAGCEGLCTVLQQGKTISPSYHDIGNGDTISTHFTSDSLGFAHVSYVSKMYNIGKYVGKYSGTATPLVVIYEPKISDSDTWVRLADAKYQSFEDRYAIAVKYDGSFGGGIDDGNSTIRTERRMKVTDISNVSFMSNPFGVVLSDWKSNATISDAQGLADLHVLDSVYSYIPKDAKFVDVFPNPAKVKFNSTSQSLQIDSAGYMRILRSLDVSKEKIERYNNNVTAYDTLESRNFGGKQITYLGNDYYDFPWGYFSVPLNVTAFLVDEKFQPQTDNTARIDHINIAETKKDVDFLSTVEFYLDKHVDDKFAFMHMADMYDMNPKKSFDSSSVLLLINKTGASYDFRSYQAIQKNNVISDAIVPPRDYVMNLPARQFFLGYSYYDVEIQAHNQIFSKTNTIQIGGADISESERFRVNMNQDNFLDIGRSDDVAVIGENVYFGKEYDVFVNGKKHYNVICDFGCIVFLPDSNPADISIKNMWGGVASAKNVTGPQHVEYDPDAWIDVAPMRLFWIASGLGIFYVVYRILRMHFRK